MDLEVRPLRLDDPAWAELTRTGVGRSAYHCPTLVRSAAATHDMDVVAWGAYADGELVSGVALTQTMRGDPRPLPIMSYTAPVYRPSPSTHRSVIDRHSARTIGAVLEPVGVTIGARLRARAGYADIRDLLASGWTARANFTYEVHLDSMTAAWDAMDDDRRRLVRRAERHGYDVSVIDRVSDHDAALHDTLMRLYLEQAATYGNSDDPDRAMWRRFVDDLLAAGHGRIYLATTADGEPVAFQFAVVWGDQAANLLTGSMRSHADAGANTLLRWRASNMLHSEGVARLDLNGAPSGSAGRFKASLGAVLTPRWELTRPDPLAGGHLTARIVRRVRREVAVASRRRRQHRA